MSNFEFEQNKYRDFCNINGDKIHPNNTAVWLDAVCIGGSWGAKFAEQHGEIVGVWPYYIKKKNGLTFATEPPFTQSLGPILVYPDKMSVHQRIIFEKDVLGTLFDEITKMKIDFIRQNLIPELTNWLPLYWKNCTQMTRYTYMRSGIRGMSEEDLLKTYTRSARRIIMSLLKAGYTCIDASDISFTASDFYDLHCNCLKKIGKKVSFDRKLLISMVESSINVGSGSLLVIMNQNSEICGATFVISNKEETIGINTAADHTIDGLGYLCNHQQFVKACELSNKYNIGGSMIEGVESVYNRFGLEQIQYMSICKNISKRYDIIDSSLRLLKVLKTKL